MSCRKSPRKSFLLLLSLLPLACGRSASPPTAAAAVIPSGPPEYRNDAQFCQALGLNCGGDTLPDRNGVHHTVYCGNCTAPQVCAARATFAGGAAGTCAPASVGLTPAQRKVAEQLTSLWENGETGLAYSYSEDIADGRGYTSGRVGFCTGTGDAIVVVACYNYVSPGNGMNRYLPALAKIEEAFVKSMGQETQPTHAGLDGWTTAWTSAAKDPHFKACQDQVVEAVYYGAAMRHAIERGLSRGLTKASLFDAQINQGESDGNYGMRTLLAQADKLTGAMANPPTLEDESRWLGNFHRLRAKAMYDDAKAWRENMYRVALYEKLRLARNFELAGCIRTGQPASAYWSPATSDPGPIKAIGTCAN
jgi:chitosanase